MAYLERWLNILNKGLMVLGGLAVLALMAIATLNICLRIFQMPYRGTYEIVAFLGAVVTAFSLGYTQKKKSHIVVDIFSDRYPRSIKKIVDVFGFFLTMIFFGIIAWVIVDWGLKIAHSGEVSETIKIIYYPFIFCVALGFAVLALTLFVDFLNQFLNKEKI